MTNENKNELKSENLSFFELFTEKKYCIEIPKIQRDYAQGRKTEKAAEVREDFLNQLKNYLDGTQRRNTLDFVYGNVTESGKLILLDGQQRLTTLFLLHWFTALEACKFDVFKNAFLFSDGESSVKSRFVYNTRESSNEFCVRILVHGTEVFSEWKSEKQNADKTKFSEIIKNQKWYFESYNNDLTIKSMLTMIDAISQKFSEKKNYFDLLADKENPAITFNFLPIKDNGLSDDLYIKMNSRGRELTRFENLKSKILAKLDESKFDKNKRNEFSKKIDTEWLDLFWRLKSKENLNHFDEILMNFFEAVFVNKFASQADDSGKSDKNKKSLKIKEFIAKKGAISFGEILSVSFFDDYISDIIRILNALSEKSDSKTNLKTFFDSDFIYYDEKSSFENLVNHSGKYENENAYPERILFFAYCAFLVKNQNPDTKKFAHWMRICANLVKNTRSFDSETDFCNAVLSVKTLLDSCDENDIYSSILSFDKKLPGLDENQLKEEKVKAFLICESDDWKNDILACEKQKYFSGQLSFALNYAGLWNILAKEKPEQKKLAASQKSKFDDCVRKTFALFDDNGVRDKAEEDARLIRALLCVSDGKYMMAKGSNWSFLNDNDRDVSWKNYLKDDTHKVSEIPTRKYFYDLIDDKLYNPEDLSSLEKIIDEHKNECSEWVKVFAENPELLTVKIGNAKLVRNSDDDVSVYILTHERMSSYHAELFTAGKYLELKKANFETKPFASLEYYFVKGNDEEPCLFLNNWKYRNFDFAIDVRRKEETDDKFVVQFFDRNNRKREEKIALPKKVTDVLRSNGFCDVGNSEYQKVVQSKVGDKKLEEESKKLLNTLENL